MSALTTGTLTDGQSMETLAVHRDGNRSPIVTTLTMTVPLSHDDIEAVLWPLLSSGTAIDELNDPDTTLFYLLAAILADGTTRLEDVRRELDALRPGTATHALYRALRARVQLLCGARPIPAPAPPAPRPRPAPGAEPGAVPPSAWASDRLQGVR
ncbi:hypothetical protein [Pseudonocardia sp. Ae505_Ps2]|uniref:hypothetical protein n=1 Tax=Pseudonocardia sp. Ae505_Ps2 TaxID=1885034 RepID=UPI00094EAB7A|nr:hypothetical protein [Pseudonocardia sp. Ae505_Ps2]